MSLNSSDRQHLLSEAQGVVRSTKDLDEFRQALAVILTLECNMTQAGVADVLGRSPSWVSIAKREFVGTPGVRLRATHGGRRHQLIPIKEEDAFLDQVCREYSIKTRWFLSLTNQQRKERTFPKILRYMLEKRVGHPVPLSTVYNLMRRVGQRKFSNYSPYCWETYSGAIR